MRFKQIYKNEKPKMNPRQMTVAKIRKIIIEIMEYTHTHTHTPIHTHEKSQYSPTKIK